MHSKLNTHSEDPSSGLVKLSENETENKMINAQTACAWCFSTAMYIFNKP